MIRKIRGPNLRFGYLQPHTRPQTNQMENLFEVGGQWASFYRRIKKRNKHATIL